MNTNSGLCIAIVAACPFPHQRGTPIRIRRLAQGLSARGHEVHVVAYHLGTSVEEEPFRTHRIRDIGWYRKWEPGPSWAKFLVLDPLVLRLLRRLMRRYEIDLIHAHHYEGLLVARCARPTCPIIYDAHTTLESELPFYRLGVSKSITRFLGRRLDGMLPARATHVIAVSEKIRARLIELGAVEPGNIDVIPGGVESRLFAIDGEDEGHVAGGRVVAFAGNLSPYQGIDYLLSAFREVVRHREDVQLLIITESSFAPYEGRARELGILDSIVVQQGVFAELPNNLAKASVLVNPRPEATGVPQKLLNYMAAGRPIVSFEGSASHLQDGETALIVKSGDVQAMAAAILRLLDDRELAIRLSTAAKAQARSEFSWASRAAQVEAVYESVLARGAGRSEA